MLEKLAQVTPSENAGSISANRFDYQRSWALCELLRLAEHQSSFLMIFEHHDDVVVLDSEEGATCAVFTQVKTKKSKAKPHWTISDFTSSKGKSPSIAAKLYRSHREFGEGAESLVITSNAGLRVATSVEPKPETQEQITFDELALKDKEAVAKALRVPGEEFSDIEGLKKIKFHQCSLHIDKHESNAKGELLEFLESQFPGNSGNFKVTAAYSAITEDIRRRSQYERSAKSATELIEFKSIGRTRFLEMLSVVGTEKDTLKLWGEIISPTLIADHCNGIELTQLSRAWNAHHVARMSYDRRALSEVEAAVSSEIVTYLAGNEDVSSVLDLIKHVRNALCDDLKPGYSAEEIDGVTLYEVFVNDSLPQADTKPEKEE